MTRDLGKTGSFLGLHLVVGFTVAYLFTGSITVAGGIALVEPLANAVIFFFHERAWNGASKSKRPALQAPCHIAARYCRADPVSFAIQTGAKP